MTTQSAIEQQRTALQSSKVDPKLAHSWENLLKEGGELDKLYLPSLALLRSANADKIIGELSRIGNIAGIMTTLSNYPNIVENADIIKLDAS